jgi:hypothetical protein
MGLVWNANKGVIQAYPEEPAKLVSNVVIDMGKPVAQVNLAPLSSDEAERLLRKLDVLAPSDLNPFIAKIVGENTEAIFTLVRMVKAEAKGEFLGHLGTGNALDIRWLRPKDVGGPILNSAAAGALGLYGGAGGAVFTWTQTFVANTAQTMIPAQTMTEEAGCIHLGAIDPVEVPKCDAIQFYIANIVGPAQPLPFNIREGFSSNHLPIARFEQPVIIGPERTQRVDVMPNLSGDSKLQLLTLVVARAQSLVL